MSNRPCINPADAPAYSTRARAGASQSPDRQRSTSASYSSGVSMASVAASLPAPTRPRTPNRSRTNTLSPSPSLPIRSSPSARPAESPAIHTPDTVPVPSRLNFTHPPSGVAAHHQDPPPRPDAVAQGQVYRPNGVLDSYQAPLFQPVPLYAQAQPTFAVAQRYSPPRVPTQIPEHPITSQMRQHYLSYVDRNPFLYPYLSWYAAAPPYGSFPIQGFHPSNLMPQHPIYVYYGRDLSNLNVPLPRLRDGRALFEQANSGDMSDIGFGPGVRVAYGVRAEVVEAERVLRTWVIEHDGTR